MKTKPIAEIVAFLQPIAEEVGVEIVDAEWNLRACALTVYIDAAGGVDLNLCEKFHRAIDEPLDEFDPTFGEGYTLNCSSPGLDRPFKTAKDFRRNVGKRIELHFYAPFEGKKYLEGELVSFDGTTVTVKTAEGEKAVPRDKTSKICLLIEV